MMFNELNSLANKLNTFWTLEFETNRYALTLSVKDVHYSEVNYDLSEAVTNIVNSIQDDLDNSGSALVEYLKQREQDIKDDLQYEQFKEERLNGKY